MAEVKTLSKHPLGHEWTLWYFEVEVGQAWADCLHEITSINTVESFWVLQDNIKHPSDLKLGSDYAFFKVGIKPMWEDDLNKFGGRWILNVDKNSPISEVNSLWLDILLYLIGEKFASSHMICGAVVSNRLRSFKIGESHSN